jgi:hypothetical protein
LTRRGHDGGLVHRVYARGTDDGAPGSKRGRVLQPMGDATFTDRFDQYEQRTERIGGA